MKIVFLAKIILFNFFITRFTFKSPEDVVDRGIQHFEFSKLNSEKFIVALEGGKLFYCSINSVSGTG